MTTTVRPARAGTGPAETAEDLLRAYRPGDAFLTAGAGTLLGTGVRAVFPDVAGAAATRGARVRAFLAELGPGEDGAAPMVTGTLPFEPDAPGHLVVPASVRHGGAVPGDLATRVATGPGDATGWRVALHPAPADHAAAVAEAVRRIQAGPLAKVVLARTATLTGPGPVDVPALLARLAALDPGGHPYAVALPAGADGVPGVFAGASPELHVRRTGRKVVTRPFGGTMPRAADPEADRAQAAALRASAKERHEHDVIVERVRELLAPYCRTLDVPAAPSLVATGAVWHLATTIEGELADPEVNAVELAALLHPTPAVGGTPDDLAVATIAELEPFVRGPYAGLVGWTDAAGDGEWVIGLRGTEVTGATARLVAGGGIVGASDPATEVAETTAKFRTALRGLGLDLEL